MDVVESRFFWNTTIKAKGTTRVKDVLCPKGELTMAGMDECVQETLLEPWMVDSGAMGWPGRSIDDGCCCCSCCC